MASAILGIVSGLVARRRCLRAAVVMVQRAMDTVLDQRQILWAMPLDSPRDLPANGWRVQPCSPAMAAERFPDQEYDIAGTSGDTLLLMNGESLGGFAVTKRPDMMSSFYFSLPEDAVYLAYIFLTPGARGGSMRYASSVLWDHLRSQGARWLVLSCNDWNEPMIRSCASAGMTRLGIGRRTGRRYRAERAPPWVEDSTVQRV